MADVDSSSEDEEDSTCDTWDSVDYKLNFTRAERSTRMTWWVWQSVVRSWVFANAATWVQCYITADAVAKDCHFRDWNYVESYSDIPSSLCEETRHAIQMLCGSIPGFAAVWRLFEYDISITIEPFWAWEEGDARSLMLQFPYICCYLAYYRRPKLVHVALITMNLLLFYFDMDEGRPDIAIIIAYNCKMLHEKLIELHNSRQTRSVAWNGNVTMATHEHQCFLAESRRVANDAVHSEFGSKRVARKSAKDNFTREHDLVTSAPCTADTRAGMTARVKALFFKALQGGCARFSSAPVKITEGWKLLVEGGEAGSIKKCSAWLKKASENYDTLYGNTIAQLKKECEGIKLDKDSYAALKRKIPLVKILRDAGWTSDDEDELFNALEEDE